MLVSQLSSSVTLPFLSTRIHIRRNIDLVSSVSVRSESDFVTSRRPGRLRVIGWILRDIALILTICVHNINFIVAVTISRKSNLAEAALGLIPDHPQFSNSRAIGSWLRSIKQNKN